MIEQGAWEPSPSTDATPTADAISTSDAIPTAPTVDWWAESERGTPTPQPGIWRRGLCCLMSLTLIISLIAGMGGGVLGRDWLRARLAREEVTAVLDDFMTQLTRSQPRHAYDLLSTRGKLRVPQSELDHLVQEGYRLLEGYDHLTIESIRVQTLRQQDPRLPQGTVAQVEASISYSDGIHGYLSAVLEKEGDHWRIYEFYINSPAKMRELQRA